MSIRRSITLLALAAGCLAIAGCSTVGPSASDAAAVAAQFSAAVAAGDAAAACELLSPGAAKSLADDAGSTCTDAILTLQIPDGGTAVHEEAYGRAGFVQLEGDSIFLTISSGGWKVRAAGCTPNGDAPYECILKGD